jgi:acyl-CoA dehydrogenase
VINGRKWWSSGVGDPRCKIAIVMGKTDFEREAPQQQSQVLMPLDTPGVTKLRHLPVFGYDDAPHGHMEVARQRARAGQQHAAGRRPRLRDRAGPPRAGPHPPLHAHHRRGRRSARKDGEAPEERVAFGKPISKHSVWEERIAKPASTST